MTIKQKITSSGLLFLLLIFALLWADRRAATAPAVSPAIVQGQSFSIAAGSSLAQLGIHPADILGAGGLPLISCQSLGLICDDPQTGVQDDLSAFSFGWDFQPDGFPLTQFSVSAASRGLTDTAVRAEASCSPAEPGSDFFESDLNGSNSQLLDGNGSSCATNSGFGLGISEGATPDGVDAGDRDPCQYVDFDCDGTPDAPVYFSLAPNSPTLAFVQAGAGAVLVTGFSFVPTVYASATALGLASGDVIDALCLSDDGDGQFGQADRMLFSLAAGSPSLAGLNASGASILAPGPLLVAARPDKLGLLPTDEIDALLCSLSTTEELRLYLPEIKR